MPFRCRPRCLRLHVLLLTKTEDSENAECYFFNAERGGEDKFEVSGHVVGDSLVYTLSPTLSYECEGGWGKYHVLARIEEKKSNS